MDAPQVLAGPTHRFHNDFNLTLEKEVKKCANVGSNKEFFVGCRVKVSSSGKPIAAAPKPRPTSHRELNPIHFRARKNMRKYIRMTYVKMISIIETEKYLFQRKDDTLIVVESSLDTSTVSCQRNILHSVYANRNCHCTGTCKLDVVILNFVGYRKSRIYYNPDDKPCEMVYTIILSIIYVCAIKSNQNKNINC